MQDLLLNSTGDLLIATGDLKIGFSDNQNIVDILQAVKGDYKRNPQIGLNAISFSNSNTTNSDIKAQVKLQLELDGFRVTDVIIDRTNGLNINPYAER